MIFKMLDRKLGQCYALATADFVIDSVSINIGFDSCNRVGVYPLMPISTSGESMREPSLDFLHHVYRSLTIANIVNRK